MPLPLSAACGARPTAQGSADMEWRIQAPSKWRPPQALRPRMEQLLRESPKRGIVLMPLHLGMWHPRLEACLQCERHEEVTTRYRCPCQRAKWRRVLQAVSPPLKLHGGMTVRIISGVPRSRTCIAEEGDGTHDWAAVLANHVHVLAALQTVEFRQ